MAERRMFTDKITESDVFLDMPLSTQALYFHFCMNADDDGFVKNPKRIQRMLGASDDDCKLLIIKRFVLPFESGVIVIKHWRMHNLLRKDRYKPTEYIEEKSMLKIKENGAYTFDEEQGIPLMATTWQPNDNQMAPQDSIGKDSIDKDIEKENNKKKKFEKPTIAEVDAYCKERNNGIDAEAFVAFYESKGWLIGKNPMKNWKSAVITWEKSRKNNGNVKASSDFSQRTYTNEQMNELFDDIDSIQI